MLSTLSLDLLADHFPVYVEPSDLFLGIHDNQFNPTQGIVGLICESGPAHGLVNGIRKAAVVRLNGISQQLRPTSSHPGTCV